MEQIPIADDNTTPFSNVLTYLRGGNTTTNYIANINYNDTEGIMLKSDNKTLSGRIEVTPSV